MTDETPRTDQIPSLQTRSLQTPSRPRRLLRLPAEIVVTIYLVFNGLIAPLFRPIMRGLSSLRLIQRLEAMIGGLPPYLILVLLVVPFAIAELAKVYAVLLIAEDHVRIGATIFISAYVVSILVCERTFHAGKAQLMTIGWFKRFFDWLMAIKERVLAWFRTTSAWRFADEIREGARGALERVRTALGAKPKGTLEPR